MEPEAVELQSTKGLQTKGTEAELFKTGQQLYEARMFSVARETFSSLRDSYPSGPYTLYAALKVGDCYYFGNEFADAAKIYDDYVKNHPGTRDLPYAQLMAARSYFQVSRGAGRNQAPLQKSLDFFNAVISTYPDSAYAKAAKVERKKVVERLAESDKLVMEFYEKKNAEEAVAARKREFDKTWGAMLAEQVESDDPAQPMKPLRSKVAQNIVTKEPDQQKREAPTVKKEPESDSQNEAYSEASIKIERVACQSGEHPFLSIELSKIDKGALNDLLQAPLNPNNGLVTFKIPDASGEETVAGCRTAKDVQVKSDGTVTIASTEPLLLTTLDSPPRLLVVF